MPSTTLEILRQTEEIELAALRTAEQRLSTLRECVAKIETNGLQNKAQNKGNLSAAVREVVSGFSREFVLRDVFEALRTCGVEFKEVAAASTLKRMVDDGEVRRLSRGTNVCPGGLCKRGSPMIPQ